ncbi:MAG: acetyl-CoA carboxylase carboxyltransferase subunit alpha [Peptostreptococcaceae bacterium]
MRTPYDIVTLARDKDRPNAKFFIDHIFDDFIEFHGDRYYGDDFSIVGGIASIDGRSVTIIGINKGRTTEEKLKSNFAMPEPEGYRKALRLMKQAEKFSRPVICLVDTPGANCGVGAEERGQGEAIARNLLEMSTLNTPIISVIIGEGGSGGALALSVSDKVFMMENSIYSILSPEGFSSILWKDPSRVVEACEVMKITSKDLLQFKIIDDIILEDKDCERTSINLKQKINRSLSDLENLETDELLDKRYKKFREIGNFY